MDDNFQQWPFQDYEIQLYEITKGLIHFCKKKADEQFAKIWLAIFRVDFPMNWGKKKIKKSIEEGISIMEEAVGYVKNDFKQWMNDVDGSYRRLLKCNKHKRWSDVWGLFGILLAYKTQIYRYKLFLARGKAVEDYGICPDNVDVPAFAFAVALERIAELTGLVEQLRTEVKEAQDDKQLREKEIESRIQILKERQKMATKLCTSRQRQPALEQFSKALSAAKDFIAKLNPDKQLARVVYYKSPCCSKHCPRCKQTGGARESIAAGNISTQDCLKKLHQAQEKALGELSDKFEGKLKDIQHSLDQGIQEERRKEENILHGFPGDLRKRRQPEEIPKGWLHV